jgi:hypothetical protein
MTRFGLEISEGKLTDATVTMLKDFGTYFRVTMYITDLTRFLLVSIFRLLINSLNNNYNNIYLKFDC